MTAATLLLLALLPGADLQGRVRASPSGDAVPYATVRLPELRRAVSAGEDGSFVLPGVPEGRWRVQASAIGYQTTEAVVSVGGGAVVRLDFDLVAAPVALARVEARGQRRDASDSRAHVLGGPPPAGMDARALMSVPALAEADVLRAVQTLPAVAAASDFSGALYVRGGSPDQTLVMLDGAPLFNPYHLGGLFGAIDPATVESVAVLPGALPARAGDRVSGVVDIRTREGGRDRVRGSGALSLISSRASIDGPLPTGRGSYAASFRRTFVDAFTGAAYALDLIPSPIPYAFTDAHLKLTHDLGGGVVTASAYLDDEGMDTPARQRRETGNDLRSDWGTLLGAVAYRRSLGAGLAAEARLGATRFHATFEGIQRVLPSAAGAELVPREVSGRTETRNLFASAEMAWAAGRNQLRAGFQADAYRMAHHLAKVHPETFGGFVVPFQREDHPRTFAAWVDDEWAPSPALTLRGGVRVLHAGGRGTAWMPRAGLRWSPRPGLALSAGAGRYAQVMHSLRDEESVASAVLSYDLLAAPAAGLLTGQDVAAGAEWSRGGTSVRVDAYAKWLHGLPLPPVPENPLESPLVVPGGFRTGEGSTRGVEVLARHLRGRALFSLSYALAYAERRVDGETFTPRFERRHTLDALAVLPAGGRGELNARLALATGQPYTPVVGVAEGYAYDPRTGRFVPAPDTRGTLLLGAHNSARLPGYLRLDAGARREYERRWFGRPVTVTPYLQVINVLNTRNILFAQPRADHETPPVLRFVPQIPVLPTVGVEWRF